MLSHISNFFLVEKCTIDNGGCSDVCTNPLNEGEDVTCSCGDTPRVIDPNGSQFQCGKFFF